MTPKEILENYRILDLAISNRENEIEKLKARATRVSASSDGSRGSGISDKVGITTAAIADEKEILIAEISELLSMKREVDRILHCISDMKDRELVRMRYINGYNAAEISNRSNYCERQVNRRISKAIEELAKCT